MAATQQEVIEQITEQAMASLAGQENADVDLMLQAFQTAKDNILAKLSAFFPGQNWDLITMQNHRFQQLLSNINAEIAQLTAKLSTITLDASATQFQDSSEWSAYTLDQATPGNVNINFTEPPLNSVKALLNTPFQGAMFSKRYANMSDAMASDIRDELNQSMINGESMDDAASRISDVMGDESTATTADALRIARTEIMRASNLGAWDVFQNQNKDIMQDEPDWFATPDDRLCPWCLGRDGKTPEEIKKLHLKARGKSDPFQGSATMPLHPRCVLPGQMVLAPELQAATKSFYKGNVIKMSLSNGSHISVTENHPILTPRGWLAAKFFKKGDQIITSTNPQRMIQSINPYNKNRESLIENVFSALEMSSQMIPASVKASSKYFHGDGGAMDGNIKIVWADSLLRREIYSGLGDQVNKDQFSGGLIYNFLFNSFCSVTQLMKALFLSTYGVMGRFGKLLSFRRSALSHACEHCGRTVAGNGSGFDQSDADGLPTHADRSREFLFGNSAFVTPAKVLNVDVLFYEGHVYDLQSGKYPLYTCNGVIVHNCRCRWLPRLKSWKDLGVDIPDEAADDARSMRNADGKWVTAPVQTFDQWQAARTQTFQLTGHT